MVAAEKGSGLAVQDLSTLDVTKLTPLTKEIISRQATINIGTIGHVAHGKSTVVRALTTVSTIRHKAEKERNITIKLGYANCKIYYAKTVDDDTKKYLSRASDHPDTFEHEIDGAMHTFEVCRHVSMVDCPGHDILMATMLSGAAVMDGAMLLVACNEPCPQPQTSEHLAAVEIMQLKNLIIIQNKVELIQAEVAKEQHKAIKDFVRGTSAEDAPIVPLSAVLGYNVDILAQYLCTQIPIPPRDFTSHPEMMVIRSFDVNKPGTDISDLKGGVVGGTIMKGVLKVGQEIEIRPGVVSKTSGNKWTCKPILSKIVQMNSEQNDLQYAVPGGLIAAGTKIDPTFTRQDNLVGGMLGAPGHCPEVYFEIECKYYLLKRLLGVKSKDGESTKVKKMQKDEILMVNVGSTSVGGKVEGVKSAKDTGAGFEKCKLVLSTPVCAEVGEKVALSRKIDKHWRLIGWGTIFAGKKIEME